MTEESARLKPDKDGSLSRAVGSLRQQLIESAVIEMDEAPIAVMTFVNLNDLYKTSTFGRFLSEQLITEMQKNGIHVIDVRKTPGIMIREGFGEYGLSRQMEELGYMHYIRAVVVGTYTRGKDRIYVNTRLLRATDGMVLSSGAIELVLNCGLASLLTDEKAPPPEGGAIGVRSID